MHGYSTAPLLHLPSRSRLLYVQSAQRTRPSAPIHEEQPHAPVEAWGGPAGEQLCGEGPGRSGGRQVNHEPAVCPGCQESQ